MVLYSLYLFLAISLLEETTTSKAKTLLDSISNVATLSSPSLVIPITYYPSNKPFSMLCDNTPLKGETPNDLIIPSIVFVIY